jgi:glutaredoxin 3
VEIKIYTTSTCPYCVTAKQYLDGRGVPYTELNVSENKEALKEMIQLTGRRSVPVIACGNDVLVGFSAARLEQIIECAKNQTPLDGQYV